MLLTTTARAYVNFGRWVADCPRDGCSSALALAPGQATYHCGGEFGCQIVTEIDWPANADDIWQVLTQRPAPATRNWAPPGHRQAYATGHPTGQTVADLIAESNEHGVS
jgi:hypothetical protein